MIEKPLVEEALAAADRALDEESGFDWIKKSSLLERAYFAGLFCGLRGIAREEDVGQILFRAISKTMFPRSADDSFLSTRTGALFESLKGELLRQGADCSALSEAIHKLAEEVHELDRDWNSRRRHIQAMLEGLATANRISLPDARTQDSAEQRDRQGCDTYRLLEELEKFARYIALLQTDHRRWRFLEE